MDKSEFFSAREPKLILQCTFCRFYCNISEGNIKIFFNWFILRSCYQLGSHTLAVPVSLHSTNRKRLCERLKNAKEVPSGAIVLLQGGEQKQLYCTDRDVLFRQVIEMMFKYYFKLFISTWQALATCFCSVCLYVAGQN